MAKELILRGFAIAVVNPNRVRALAKAMGILAITEQIDGRLMALKGAGQVRLWG